MKRILCCFFVGLFFHSVLYAQDAASIIDASRNRINADTISSRSKMIITAKDGSTTERGIDQYSKDGKNGSRTVIVFTGPASIRGTRFLTMEKQNSTDDRWIYLPELGKVRRIAASEGSNNFMGTDMSYDDISSADRDTDKDDHKILREESLDGKPSYVIESIPKDKSYQYSKMISWIDKSNSVCKKLELYDKRETLCKVYETLELKEVQGHLSPWVSKMTTTKDNTFTTIFVEILKYDDPIPEAVFTTNYLEIGKAR